MGGAAGGTVTLPPSAPGSAEPLRSRAAVKKTPAGCRKTKSVPATYRTSRGCFANSKPTTAAVASSAKYASHAGTVSPAPSTHPLEDADQSTTAGAVSPGDVNAKSREYAVRAAARVKATR
jgi:hypothetical protein